MRKPETVKERLERLLRETRSPRNRQKYEAMLRVLHLMPSDVKLVADTWVVGFKTKDGHIGVSLTKARGLHFFGVSSELAREMHALGIEAIAFDKKPSASGQKSLALVDAD